MDRQGEFDSGSALAAEAATLRAGQIRNWPRITFMFCWLALMVVVASESWARLQRMAHGSDTHGAALARVVAGIEIAVLAVGTVYLVLMILGKAGPQSGRTAAAPVPGRRNWVQIATVTVFIGFMTFLVAGSIAMLERAFAAGLMPMVAVLSVWLVAAIVVIYVSARQIRRLLNGGTLQKPGIR